MFKPFATSTWAYPERPGHTATKSGSPRCGTSGPWRPAQLEIETKYDLTDDLYSRPSPALPGCRLDRRAVTHELEATYFDTRDLALTAAGITVAATHRGPDAGWHVSCPPRTAGTRSTSRSAGPRRRCPRPLRQILQTVTRGPALAAARRRTLRIEPFLMIPRRATGRARRGQSTTASTAQNPGGGRLRARGGSWRSSSSTGASTLLDAAALGLLRGPRHRTVGLRGRS